MKTFEQQQQELVDAFKSQLAEIAKKTISEFYTDVTTYAEVDASLNFRNMIRDEVFNELIHEIKSKYSHYSYAHQIRMKLLENHKEEISNKIIEDLQDKVASLEDQYSQLIRKLS